jgi:hypothetical protein
MREVAVDCKWGVGEWGSLLRGCSPIRPGLELAVRTGRVQGIRYI